jgi:phage portal protein BeeE
MTRRDVAYIKAETIMRHARRQREHLLRNRPREGMTLQEFRRRLMRDLGIEG